MIADEVRNDDAGEGTAGEGGLAAPVQDAPVETAEPVAEAPKRRTRAKAADKATEEKTPAAPKKRATSTRTTTRTKKAAADAAAAEAAPQLTLDSVTPEAAEVAPVNVAPAPVVETPAPVFEAPAPVVETPVPAEPTPAPVAAAPVAPAFAGQAAPPQTSTPNRIIGDEMPDDDDAPITVPPLVAFGENSDSAPGEVASGELGLTEGFPTENRPFERNPLRFRSGRAQLRGGPREPNVREGGFREGGPREGGFREGGPREPNLREGAPREAGPREGGFRDGGPREGGFRDGAPREGGPREGNFRDGGPRDRGPREEGGRQEFGMRGRNIRPGAPGYANGGGFNREREEGNYQQNQPQGRRREYDLLILEPLELSELHRIAGEFGIETPPLRKEELIDAILESQALAQGNLLKKGILEILPDGKGFLRCSGYLQDDGDVYVSSSQIKRFNLKTGDTVTGAVRAPKDMERFHGLLRVEAINGLHPEVMKQRKEFEKLTPIFPDEKFKLETDQRNITARIIDLVTPIGKGQRGLIVAPPKAGKTSLIKSIANSIASNHPEVVLIVLLIDERPEEVTDISRSVRGEVVASTFDEMPENHMRVADMVMEKAKRLVEMKKDVVILMDSITRLSRASNLVVSPSGRTLSGGLDPAAMYRPKRMFGAARNIEEGGSLTILATALVDTGSRMDEMIFEEFKGTGNMDLVLDRSLFDQRIFPSIDINKSGTRRDDLLMNQEELAATFHLRRTLAALDNDKSITLLIDRLKNTKSNQEFMQIVSKSARNAGSGTPTQ